MGWARLVRQGWKPVGLSPGEVVADDGCRRVEHNSTVEGRAILEGRLGHVFGPVEDVG